jgi:hypothetical protein
MRRSIGWRYQITPPESIVEFRIGHGASRVEIVPHGTTVKQSVLGDCRKAGPEGVQADFSNINSIDCYVASCQLHNTEQRLSKAGFPGTSASDDTNLGSQVNQCSRSIETEACPYLFARHDLECNTFEDKWQAFTISKLDVVKFEMALLRPVGRRVIRFGGWSLLRQVTIIRDTFDVVHLLL